MKNKITAQVYLFQELWQNLKHFMRGHFIQHKPFISEEWPDMTLSGQKVYKVKGMYKLKPEKSFQGGGIHRIQTIYYQIGIDLIVCNDATESDRKP